MKRAVLIFAFAVLGCGETTATTEEPAYVLTEAPAEYGQDPTFYGRELDEGNHVEYPSHWYALSENQSADVTVRASTIARVEGLAAEGKRTLLAVNATPQPTGAMIRVSVTSPATITQSELEQAIRHGRQAELLQSVHEEFASRFPSMMARAGVTVSDISPPQFVTVAERPAMLITYRRTSAVDGALWEVRLYQIAADNQTIELTLSNRISDRTTWIPILDRTLDTFAIRRAT